MVRKKATESTITKVAEALSTLTEENSVPERPETPNVPETSSNHNQENYRDLSRAIIRTYCRLFTARRTESDTSSVAVYRSRSPRRQRIRRRIRRRERTRYYTRNLRTRNRLRRIRRLLLRHSLQLHSGDWIIPIRSRELSEDDLSGDYPRYVINVVTNDDDVEPQDSYSNRNVPFFLNVSDTGLNETGVEDVEKEEDGREQTNMETETGNADKFQNIQEEESQMEENSTENQSSNRE